MGKASPHSHKAHARPFCPCSPAPHWEHMHAVTATAIHHRRPCSAAAPRAHHPPLDLVGSGGRIGPVLPRPNPRRRREHVDQNRRPPSRAVEGSFAISFPVLGFPVQETEDLFVKPLASVSCQLVKFIEMCRKIQKLPNQFY
jgi:hypothetical protein